MALVKVKILKYVGEFVPGQIAEVEKELAVHLCAEKSVWDGEKQVPFKNAILLEDAEKLESAPIDIETMTAADMTAIGAKNIVHVPVDEKKKQEDYLKSIGVIRAAKEEVASEIVDTKAEKKQKGEAAAKALLG